MLPRLYRSELEERHRQINTLMVFNDNVTEVQEGTEYKIAFTAGKSEFCLYILLTSDFPNEKPILKILPVVQHPWVSPDGNITSAPGLLNFTVHSDLGRVVHAIIREFERTPPPLITSQTCNAVVMSPTVPIHEIDNMGRISPSYKYNYTAVQNFSPPAHFYGSTGKSAIFPDLNDLSFDELEFLNECDERQEEFVENLPQMQELNRTIDKLISDIDELADSNVSKEEHLQNLSKNITSKIEEVTKLTFETERLNSSYQTLSEKYSPKNIKEQLREAAEKSSNECEKVAESFLNGELDVDKFVNTYIYSRTLNQTRKTKEEKLAQQLENLEKAGF